MKNLLLHIDSRRIHGQVIAGWGVQEQVKRFLLANDAVAADEWERNQYLATPGPDFETYVTTVDEAVELLKTWADGPKTMLITTSPRDAVRILDGGIVHDRITIGNLDPGPGKHELTPSVFIDDDERRDLIELMRRGITVVLQPLPGTKPMPVSGLLEANR